jgi:DNA-binding protein HU-beta
MPAPRRATSRRNGGLVSFDSLAASRLYRRLGSTPRFTFDDGVTVKRGQQGMNKQELIAAVAESSGLPRGDASRAVEAVFETISSTLKKGQEVRLVGFGTFSLSRRKASTGRNPRTGEAMTIKASTQPKFKAGKVLKDSVN